jgi:hypothetical protein
MQSAVRPPHRSLILSSTLPLEDEPTREEGSVPHEDDPTDSGGGAAA